MVAHDVTLGFIFLIVGIGLLIVEAASPGFFVGVPATILIILGLMGIFIEGFFFSPLAPIIAIAVAAPLTYVTILLYQRLAPPAPPQTTVGTSLVGRQGRVVRDITPDSIQGKVNIDNQEWSATAGEPIPAGQRVRVVGSRGVHVTVERVTPEEPGSEATAEQEETGSE